MKDKEITVTADELQKQKLYTADVAAIMQVRAMHGTPKALVRTYGCQQNVADGERMKGMLSERALNSRKMKMKPILFCSTPVPFASTPKTACSATSAR